MKTCGRLEGRPPVNEFSTVGGLLSGARLSGSLWGDRTRKRKRNTHVNVHISTHSPHDLMRDGSRTGNLYRESRKGKT